MPYPASLIAYAFVKKGITSGQPVTQMKLQKLVYFAHGFYLANYNTPLIQEEFEAWQFGPVVPSIYHDYKSFGKNPIIVDNKDLDTKINVISNDAQVIIDYTWDVTKNISALTLSNWTHIKGSPWEIAYIPNSVSIPIDNNEIGTYFKNKFIKNTPTTASEPAN